MTNTPPRPGRLMASFNLQSGEPQTVAVPWSRAGLLRGMAERQGQRNSHQNAMKPNG